MRDQYFPSKEVISIRIDPNDAAGASMQCDEQDICWQQASLSTPNDRVKAADADKAMLVPGGA